MVHTFTNQVLQTRCYEMRPIFCIVYNGYRWYKEFESFAVRAWVLSYIAKGSGTESFLPRVPLVPPVPFKIYTQFMPILPYRTRSMQHLQIPSMAQEIQTILFLPS